MKELGYHFTVRTKETDESFPADLKAQEIALFLCKKKAAAFDAELKENTLLLTADTIVWVQGNVLNKPADEKEALEMLMMLSGKMHEVFTGICLKSNKTEKVFFVRSEVCFKPLNEEQVLRYVRERSPFDKAGSYGAQECLPEGMDPCSEEERYFLRKAGKPNLAELSKGPHYGFIDKIQGSYFNVMGLPVVELSRELKLFS